MRGGGKAAPETAERLRLGRRIVWYAALMRGRP